MKSTSIALLLIVFLIASIYGEEKRQIVLHAIKIIKVNAYRALILEDDYGYVVLNDGTEEKPKPRYILGSQSEGSVIHFTDKEKFLAAIAKVPKGARLREYEKCLVPLSWGLTEEQLVDKDVSKIAKARGIKYSEEPKEHCNCQSSLLRRNEPRRSGVKEPATAPKSKPAGDSKPLQEPEAPTR